MSNSHARRLRPLRPPVPIVAAILGAGVLAACAAAGLGAIANTGMIALNVLRKAFVGVAGANYGEPYKEDADKLFHVMAKSTTEKPADTAASAPAAGAAAAAAVPADPATTSPAAGSTTPAGSPAATGPATDARPLALEVSLLKQEIVDGRSIQTPVQDGEILYDRFGTHGDGDNIKFMFRTTADAYVYVISIDTTGWIQPIFPGTYAGFTNPVSAHKTYVFPEADTWAPLDSYRGVEHLYFIASRTPRPDLEASLVAFAAKVRDVDPNRTDTEPVAFVMTEAPISRGFDAPRQSTVPGVPTSTGETPPVDSQIFASNGPGDIVVTRWFRHQ